MAVAQIIASVPAVFVVKIVVISGEYTMAETIRLTNRNKSIRHLVKNDPRLKMLIDEIGTIQYKKQDDPYGFLIHEIIEQMLSVKAARKIHGRLLQLCSGNISPEIITALNDDELKTIGTSIQKVRYIRNLTEAVMNGVVNFSALPDYTDEQVMKTLTAIPGIGNWTAKMFLIFVLDRQDVLPYEDGAFKQSFKWLYNTDDASKENITLKCSCWSPYASIASRYLYRALDSGVTKTSLFKDKNRDLEADK